MIFQLLVLRPRPIVQLGVLRTGALDQYDDDGDGDGDDDDEEVGLSSEAWRVSNEAEPK